MARDVPVRPTRVGQTSTAEPTTVDYRRIFAQAPGVVLVVSADSSFTIVDASEAYLQATFLRREDLVGRALFDVLPQEPVETRVAAIVKLRNALEEVLSTGRPNVMPVQRFDIVTSEAEGGGSVERFWSAVNSPIFAADGALAYIVHSIDDVTDFVRSSRAMVNDDDTLRLEILHRGQMLAAANAQLREVVTQFQAMYDQGLFAGRVGLDGTVLDVNRSSLEQCGYIRAEVVGKPFWECGWWNRSADVQEWVKNAVERAARGETFRGLSTYYWSDGTERIVDFACMPVKDESGRVLFVFPTGMDITERASVERNLRATEILESITEGFFALDPEWCFTYVNRAAQRIWDRAPNDLIGKVIWAEHPGLRGSEFEPAYRQAMDDRVASAKVTAYYAEHRRWYETQTYPAVEGIAVYFRDVTAEIEAKAAHRRLVSLSERQRRIYEAALSNTPDLVYVVDASSRFIYANQALLATLGITREELIGNTCLDLGYPPSHAEMHFRELKHVIATRLPVRSEVPFTGRQGKRVYDYLLVPVLGADGKVVAVAGTARDITDRQAAEEAIREHADALREADRAKDEFLATLAHELRNPLAPLRNALHLLRESAKSADDAPSSLLTLMERQLSHLVRLVDDLLEMSRISRGTLVLRKEKVELADVVRNAVETSKPLIDAARHTLQVSVPEESLWLEGDPVRLAQIVANLLNNAARYTDNGGQISLLAARRGEEATIRVIDNGIGIEPEALPRVFEMFSRGAEIAGRDSVGLGIGLALARRLAGMHGGSIEAHSGGRGKGSEFVVQLPLAAAPDERTRAGPLRVAEGRSLASARVLVVDDNRDAAESLAMIVRSFGAEAAVACSGPEALHAFETFAPGIVFLDIGMPLMDGYEVARRLRSRYPDSSLTLIALTGWGQVEDRRKARAAGFDYHVVKPADIDTLRKLVGAEGAASVPSLRDAT